MPNDINRIHEFIPELSDQLVDKFLAYFDILEDFNGKMNLVSQSSLPHAGMKHFADSYYGLQFILDKMPQGHVVYDLGSGNGFPGTILSLLRPDLKIVMVERDLRKGEFLKHLNFSLAVKNSEVFVGDVKELKNDICDVAISRAMSPMPRMLLEAREFMKTSGHLYLFKNEYWTSEFSAIPPQLFDYWEVDVLNSYQLHKTDIQKFIVDCTRV